VTHVVDVGAELGGFAGTDLLRQLGKEILAQLVIGRALLGDSLLLTLQGANFLVQMLDELILLRGEKKWVKYRISKHIYEKFEKEKKPR